jgi:hypothetical protein
MMQFTNENDMKVEVEELKDRSSWRDLFFFCMDQKNMCSACLIFLCIVEYSVV